MVCMKIGIFVHGQTYIHLLILLGLVGVQHFYLVDDESTDNPKPILDPYIEEGLVTMYPPTPRNVPFRQVH